MVFLDWKELPWYWWARLVPVGAASWWSRCRAARVRVRLLRVPLAHQGRVLLDHHAGADLSPRCCCSSATTPASAATTASPTSSASSATHHRPETRACCSRLSGARLIGAAAVLARWLVTSQVRPRADRDPRRGVRVMFCGYNPLTTSSSSGRCRRCCAASPARCTCRRSASSTRARCRPPTRSRSRSGWRSAAAAR
jgi:hypothetical protein